MSEVVLTLEQRKAAMTGWNGHQAGILWFTGLSGAGKSTLAAQVQQALHNRQIRTIALDGDVLRRHLCKDLGFSPEDRRENIRRVGEVAKLFVDAGLVVLASFISPYESDRQQARRLVKNNEFIEIHVKCSFDECEKRDVKGLYARARAGEIQNFTGLDAPYEAPTSPDIEVNTELRSVEESVQHILTVLEERQFFESGGNSSS